MNGLKRPMLTMVIVFGMRGIFAPADDRPPQETREFNRWVAKAEIMVYV